jgi:phenylacetate-CoA ligase
MLEEQRELLRLTRRRLPSADEIEAIRLRRLRDLLQYAFDNVPFYRGLLQSNGLVPSDVRSVSDLRRLPVTNRDQLREAGPDRISRKVNQATSRTRYTSGSGGSPLAIFRTHTDERLRKALELRSMTAAGVRWRDNVVTLGPALSGSTMLTRFGVFRTTFVSITLPVEEQARCLRDMQPDVLWVYPTALRSLLHHVGALSSIIRPRMIVINAEPLDESLRQRLLSDLPLEFRNFYGSVETGRISFECPAGEGLHINTDCSILELDDQQAVEGAGRPVIITNLLIRAAPFIRYRLGDYVELIDHPCSCGSPLPLMKPPVGREWDVIRLPDGKLVSPWGCNSILRAVPNLLQFRLIQKQVDLLVLLLQFSESPGRGFLDSLRCRLVEQLGQAVSIQIELVDHIDNTTLKFRAFISQLKTDDNGK